MKSALHPWNCVVMMFFLKLGQCETSALGRISYSYVEVTAEEKKTVGVSVNREDSF